MAQIPPSTAKLDDIVPLKVAIRILKERSDIKNIVSKLENILNKLEHGNPIGWKPSEEQMEALKWRAECPSAVNHEILANLYDDLQRLL